MKFLKQIKFSVHYLAYINHKLISEAATGKSLELLEF